MYDYNKCWGGIDQYGKCCGRIAWVWEMLLKNCMSMGNVKEVLYEYGKFCGRILWVWEILWKNIMSMGNAVEELYEYGKG